MEETVAVRYWCHMCSQMVNSVMEADIKCLFSQVGKQHKKHNKSIKIKISKHIS